MEFFREIGERLRDPVLLLEQSSRVVVANSAACQQLGEGLQGTELIGRLDDPERFRRYLRLASRSTHPLPGGFVLAACPEARWRCDASLLRLRSEPALLVFVHLRPAAHATARFLALNEQIDKLHLEIRRRAALEHERLHLLESERAARLAAEEASRLKDEFLASISHELRTPLHAISGWLAVADARPGDPAVLARTFDVIKRNVATQIRLTEDLVDLSRITSGRMRLALRPVELDDVLSQVIESVRPAAEARGVRLELLCDQGGCVVNGDADRLQQIFWNLLSNATRHTPRDGRVQVVLRRVNSHVEIAVSDTGEGIAPELLPFVFDRFRQADGSRTRRHGGLGLGLAIVRHLVELHGGVVTADSAGPGHGACFTVNLPLPLFRRSPVMLETIADSAAPDAQASPVTAAASASPEVGELHGVRVLLVEDHEDSRDLLATFLGNSGAAVTAVESSMAAQVAFAAQPPHVVISDIEMPGEDGFTLIRKLRVLERERALSRAPAIAVTAHAFGDARVRALRSGFQAFLSKPINPHELIALVASLCRLDEV